jgi:AcrR family transcriptional regulator
MADDALLDAAARVLEKGGLGSLTAEAVAAEAGINRVTLYRRRTTPTDLVLALLERAGAGFRDALLPALAGRGSGLDRLRTACEGVVTVTEANLALLAALFDGPAALTHLEVGGRRLTRVEFTDPLRRLLEDGAADGSIRALDVEPVSEVLFNQVSWTYVHLRRTHRWSRAQARTHVVDLAIAGVAAR